MSSLHVQSYLYSPSNMVEKQQERILKRNNKTLTDLFSLITFDELCYLRIYQNASVKCHLVNGTKRETMVATLLCRPTLNNERDGQMRITTMLL